MEFYYLSERQHYFHYFRYFTTCLRGNTIFTNLATLLLVLEATQFLLISLLYYLCEKQHYFPYFRYFTSCVRGNTIFTTFAILLPV